MSRKNLFTNATVLLATLGGAAAFASSHREAPFTAANPTIDGTDFYMFKDYGAGAASPDDVVLIANYNPLQDPYGGPNYFSLNQNGLYSIEIDNNGDAKPDISFQFQFKNVYKGTALPTGAAANVAIPLIISGQVKNSGDNAADPSVNAYETYSVTMVRGGGHTGTLLKNPLDGTTTFQRPLDNIGGKTFPNGYAAYADNFIYDNVSFGACGTGKIFVGQRKDGFVVNLGEIFDLVNIDGAANGNAGNPLGNRDVTENTLAGKNITTIAMEVPTACLTKDGATSVATKDPVLGAWTTAYLRQARVLNPAPKSTNDAEVEGGAWTHVSRLGNPLVNEVVIGLPDKDRFNDSEPKDDVQFATYVTNPTLPVLVNALFGVPVPKAPRNDLVAAFLTGLSLKSSSGALIFSNDPSDYGDPVQASEMLRLNTAVAPVAAAAQNNLGLLACDVAGFPNGRRPADDVVDIELTAAEGAIYPGDPNKLQTCDVSSGTPVVVNAGAVVNDGAEAAATDPNYYQSTFPFLTTPVAGSNNAARAAGADNATTTGTAAGGDIK
ncbi:MAG: DUF4331 domain-containing protein [Gammaproteobacteria bacterium]|nr:DUF4331 domain-containing protein [Gammaproteobacteria bacterium]